MKNNLYKWLEEPEEMTGILFWKITYLWQRKINKSLRKVDLTHSHFALLLGVAWLEKEGKPITQTKLANFTQTNVMVTSKIIRTLEDKGFIDRIKEGKDPRAKYVHLTDKGLKTLEKASKISETINKEFFGVLGKEKQEFAENLWKILYANSD
ncbi:MAG TPA: MarR family transcriptional regulator [Methanobacterium sp.]|jgi:DNA-binding MarR family transcriptional regulator|nr:MarR family transcriptional regulator [Methanobacterium sp.]HOI40752.1 MarR family transcriptional regulator [Methanobacterium sp.]